MDILNYGNTVIYMLYVSCTRWDNFDIVEKKDGVYLFIPSSVSKRKHKRICLPPSQNRMDAF